MEKRKLVLLISLSAAFVLSLGVVSFAAFSSSETSNKTEKTPYQLYCEAHPEYKKDEATWLQELINGGLDEKKTYIVRFNSNGGSSISDQTVKEGEKIIKPDNPSKLGYSFKQWNFKNEEWIFFGYSVNENMTLDAVWTLDNYKISYNLNGGSLISGTNPVSYNVNSSFSFVSPEKYGYKFGGWYADDDSLYTEIKPGKTGDLSLSAKWISNKYNLNISTSQPERGNVEVVGEGYTGESILAKANAIDPYVFKGWYDENNNLISKDSSYNFKMPAGDLSLFAQFDEERELLIDFDQSKGSIIGQGNHIIGEEVVVECVPNSGSVFKGWFNGDELVSRKLLYSFEMPSHNLQLICKFMTDEEIEEYEWQKEHGVIPVVNESAGTISFGMYPQKRVSDSDLISNLDNLELIGERDPQTGFYKLNGNLYEKLESAAPSEESGNKDNVKFDDGNKILKNRKYWFEVLPVTWKILSSDNAYLLLSNDLLDVHSYHSNYDMREDDQVYPNNYGKSDIRYWLTNDFYNKLFPVELSSDYVLDTTVDNSAMSTEDDFNPYVCADTVDKIYLPSYREYLNPNYGFAEHEHSTIDRVAKTTDYARAVGSWVSLKPASLNCGYSWLRSPTNITSGFYAWRLSYGGGMNQINDVVENKSTCVRPLIQISKD